MAQASKTFRIFVSSTFSDLVEERNALQQHVFPRLRELCMQYGCRFQAIDLRWGVSEEASRDQQTVKICLEEIKRCQRVTPRPNFIVLLGDRYGWRPLPAEIPAAEFDLILQGVTDPNDKALLVWDERQPDGRKGWYRRDDNAVPAVYCLQPRTGDFAEYARWQPVERRLHWILLKATAGIDLPPGEGVKYKSSATEQEIVRGALNVEDAKEHVFCFFRRITNLDDLINDLSRNENARRFVDADESAGPDREAFSLQGGLKQSLRERLPGNAHDYEAEWRGDDITTDHIGGLPEKLEDCLGLIDDDNVRSSLCVDVWRRLSRIILDEIGRMESVDPLEKEIEDHREFGEERAKFFTGRARYLDAISDYVGRSDPHPLVVWGESGSGKSALMAKAIADRGVRNADCVIVSRFIGATPASSDGRALLESLCREISRSYGAAEADIPAGYGELVGEFPRRLALATADKPLIVFLDALDQLSDADNARSLIWLPASLPPHVRLIVSVTPGDCLTALEKRIPAANLSKLEVMPKEEGETLLDLWLEDARRTLQREQRAEVLSKFAGCRLPLYLKLAFEEARLWRSYDGVVALGADVAGIIGNLFGRLSDEANHGEVMVSRSLGYLAAGRNGLTEDELLDVLSRDERVMSEFRRRSPKSPEVDRLPVVVWSRLYFDLEPYLTERAGDGASLLGFYHRQLGEAVAGSYLVGEARQERHRSLAAYFVRRADPGERGLWDGNYPRGLSELAYHLLEGRMYDVLFQVARDETFLQAQASTFIEEPAIQLDTLQKALAGAAQIDDAAKMAEFMLGHAQRMVKVAEISPLDALREGRLEQALNLAGLIFSRDKGRGVLWFLLLAWHLKRQDKDEAAGKILSDLAARDLARLPEYDWKDEIATFALCELHDVDVPSFLVVQEKFLSDRGQLMLGVNLLAIYERQGINSQNERIIALAFQIADRIKDESFRAGTLSNIAEAQAEAGKVEEAIKTAREINHKYYRACALRAVAKAQDAAGKVGEAQKTVKEIYDESHGGSAPSEIARAQAAAGNVEEAIKTAEITYRDIQERTLGEKAEGQSAGTKDEEALKRALEINDEFWRTTFLSKLAESQVAAGKLEEAFTTAREITHGDDRTRLLSKIAKAQVATGRVDEATKTFEEALKGGRRINHERDQAPALRALAKAQALAGKVEEALKTIRELKRSFERSRALSEIAQAQAVAGKDEEALKTARQISDESDRGSALSEIAKAQIATGKVEEAAKTFDEAIMTAKQIGSEEERVLTLSEIAQAQAAVEKDEEALKTAREISGAGERALALSAIAQAQAIAGKDGEATRTFEEAIETAREISISQASWLRIAIAGKDKREVNIGVDNRARVLKEISEAQADARRADEAFKTALEIDDEFWRALALSKVAKAQVTVEKGEKATKTFEEALKTAREISGAGERTGVLREIARAQAEGGKYIEASRTFEEAIETAREIGDRDRRAEALRDIARAQAEARKVDDALKTALEINGEIWRALALSKVANAQVADGRLEEALKTARGINRTYERSLTLSKIAQAQAAAGRDAEAIKTMQSILVASEDAIPQVAEVFVTNVAKDSFKQLLAPASYHISASYKMCGLLAQLYADDEDAIDKIAALVMS